jgi:hypothetical protein
MSGDECEAGVILAEIQEEQRNNPTPEKFLDARLMRAGMTVIAARHSRAF